MLVFKTSAINRSAIPPRGNEEHVVGAKSIVHFLQMLKRGHGGSFPVIIASQ